MKHIRILCVLFLALALGFGLAAQTRVSLTVIASEGPAQVILSGRLLGVANPRFTAQVAPGTYELLVRKAGLPEFKQQIVIGSAGLTVNANLGSPTTLPPPVVVTPNHSLRITGNVQGAEVYLNNVKAGTIPFNQSLPQGSYNLRVTAPGYQDYSAGIVINGNQNLVVNLVGLFATITVQVPDAMVNRAVNNPFNQISLFVNDSRVSGFSVQVPAGQHKIRLVSGGLSLEGTITVQAGRNYILQPSLSFNIQQ